MLLFMAPTVASFILLPVILQTSFGLDALQAGVFVASSSVMIVISSAIVGRWYNRFGPKQFIIIGGGD